MFPNFSSISGSVFENHFELCFEIVFQLCRSKFLEDSHFNFDYCFLRFLSFHFTSARTMVIIYSVYIISKSGGLIFSYDHNPNEAQIEKTFSHPLDFKLDYVNQHLQVVFGQRDGIRVGHCVLAINGEPVQGRKLSDRDVLKEVLANEANFPISIKFGVPRLSANEKIVLASMFHSMYAIAALQICGHKQKPDGTRGRPVSSGIETLETDNFRLNCFQTVTGVKFLVITDPNSTAQRELLLRKIYELYADYVLKNPFYSLDMPIR